MRHLFSSDGEAALAATLKRGPLLAFDFDGTLAPIVAQPDDVRVPLAVAQRLERLSALLPLAIISGRGVDDVRKRLAFQPHYIIGNHGAEDASAPPNDWPASLDATRAHLHQHRTELDAAGVLVEDKQHSIALHYRLAPDRARALELITRVATGLGPHMKVFGGKCVVNVVSAQAPDKAQAVASLVQRCKVHSAVFVGDDINDEPVFARREPSWLTIRVGRDDPSSLAQFGLDNTNEVASMLDRMLVLLSRPSPH